ncbi:hypothetical protein ABZ826_06290 [Streptomyces sp. NPDC047515]|uniref:hypothetical protein n=1 Tax=Streptomyces sp. NPDC047515 TaxID=3155380 RepID=UPI0033D5C4C0
MKVRQGVVVAALGIALMGCGVQPTGVIGAGESASGPTRGFRLYFVSADGLRGVPVPDVKIKDLDSVVKLLLAGPSPAAQGDGLTSFVELPGFSATGTGSRVTLRLYGPYPQTGRDQGTGQLVCTLARAQSVLDQKVRTDDVEVTLRSPEGATPGPYRCADFLNR